MTAPINHTRSTIDANGMTLGRIASRAAILLRGKHKPSYTPNIDAGDFVHIENLRGVRFTGNKLVQHLHHHYSGYPGGLRSDQLGNRWAKNPERVVRTMVSGMLAPNRLRAKMIRRLTASW